MTGSFRTVAVLGAVAAAAMVLTLTLDLSAAAAVPALARLQAAGGALAVLGGVAAVVRSRVDGFAPAWWVGLTLLAVGAQCLVGSPLAVSSSGLQTAAGIVALGCAARAVLSPAVDTTISPIRTVGLCVIAGALSIPLAEAFGSAGSGHRIASVGLAGLFGLLAVGVVSRRRLHPDAIWSGLLPLVAGLGLASLAGATVPPSDPAQPIGPSIVMLMTFCFATVQIVGELRAAGSLQRRAAFEAELHRRQAEERYAETIHEVRSTVRALEGGMRCLGTGASGDAQRESSPSLARALAGEIERLHQLVSEVDAEDTVTRYNVNRALEPMLAVSAAGGWPVHWTVPEDLEASGRPAELAQVVHGLLVNATRYAPGSPIDVSARAEHDFVLVHVDDRGPGVDRGMRASIFERGVQDARHGDREGHGLGLYIARSMLRSAGGDVWVEPRIGGGSRFVVAVPTGDPMARRVGASPDNVTPFVRPLVSERAVKAQGVGRR